MDNDKTNTKPSEMNPEDLPDVRAFHDEFTRDFLQSAEETREGYYPFLSGTGAYKMDFPAGGVIGEQGYSKEKKDFESFIIGVENDNGTESSIEMKYYSYKRSEFASSGMGNLEKSMGKELQFKKVSQQGKTYYFAPFKRDSNIYGYASFIQNEVDGGGILVIYTTECNESGTECEKIKESEKEKIVSWLKSIEFIQLNKG
ncbi:hypothetical protein GCM10011409_42600 [Lentibacillus populi]|uniref:Uncharacterized protein n=1 Tax=Lentibacillus populi TaxID=1827502 RepID=A0A9W5X7E3_9BACI|nr:hypothetical protein [Lentibacillus populi]MBT2217797.1 hypothetical protein [Virgibacillus dakarensis]GGB60753.1 hypothetical protein GCM10011409_42600 [Lentibacillus populi]